MTRRNVQRAAQRNAARRVAERAADLPGDEHAPTPFVTREAEAPQRTKQPHPIYPDRWADGTVRPGFSGPALKTGRYCKDPTKLPVEMQDAVGDLSSFRAGIVSDRGGASELATIDAGYVDRLVEAEGLVRLLGHDLRVRGVFSVRGRVRSAFNAYMAAVDRWDKIAKVLGLGRRQRDIGTMTAREYQEHFEHEGGVNDHDSPHDQNGETDQNDET